MPVSPFASAVRHSPGTNTFGGLLRIDSRLRENPKNIAVGESTPISAWCAGRDANRRGDIGHGASKVEGRLAGVRAKVSGALAACSIDDEFQFKPLIAAVILESPTARLVAMFKTRIDAG